MKIEGMLALALVVLTLTSAISADQETTTTITSTPTSTASTIIPNTQKPPIGLKTVLAELLALWGSVVAHEGGHALAASLLKPGSVQKFYVGLFGGYVHFNQKGLSPLSKIAIYSAGPFAGALFSYAIAKSIDVMEVYKHSNNLKTALATAWKKPLLTDPKDNDLQAMKKSARTNILLHAFNLLAFDLPTFLSPTGHAAATDGKQILHNLILGQNRSFRSVPFSITYLWNAALIAGVYATYKWLSHTAKQYQEPDPQECPETEKTGSQDMQEMAPEALLSEPGIESA